jgi:glutamyl-Q tRNA(Asp) synthetase
MMPTGRFAPSPTGDLHHGSLIAAVGSWLRARHRGGRWLVRMDDIDPPREVDGASTSILHTLESLGLVADEAPVFQSQRGDAYRAAFDELRARGQLFACWCSRSDLAAHAGLHRDGVCVTAPQDDRPPAWRLRVPDIDIAFDDVIAGPQRERLRETAGDFVILRADGLWSYQLACVVDDAAQSVDEVVRGRDLLDSTARQIHLQRQLGLPQPAYMHLPLLVDAEGRKLSKSTGASPVDPAAPLVALRAALARLGIVGVDGQTPAELLTAAVGHFDPARIAAASSHLYG